MDKEQYIFQFIQDYDNRKLKNIVKGLSNKNNNQDIQSLIKELQFLESLICDYEMQIIESNSRILYRIKMMRMLQDWVENDKFKKKHSIINFIDTAIKYITKKESDSNEKFIIKEKFTDKEFNQINNLFHEVFKRYNKKD